MRKYCDISRCRDERVLFYAPLNKGLCAKHWAQYCEGKLKTNSEVKK